jgi:hypothetical protein
VTKNDQLVIVVRLACDVEDRSDTEQRALIAFAWELDKAHNRNTTSNRGRHVPGFRLQDLVSEVDESRVLHDTQKPIDKPKRWAETWSMWTEGR